MAIRPVCKDDLEALTALGVEFGMASQRVHTMSVNADKIQAIILSEDPSIIKLALDENGVQGFILGVILSTYFSDDLVLQQLGFFVRPGMGFGGLRLLRAFEAEARARKVTKVVVGCKPGFSDIEGVYRRMGYQLLETQFIKTEI